MLTLLAGGGGSRRVAALAACVNVVPAVTSHYVWQGRVHADDELLLVIKTRASLAADVAAHIEAHHPYDVPECVVLPIAGGSAPYLDWISDATEKTRGD